MAGLGAGARRLAAAVCIGLIGWAASPGSAPAETDLADPAAARAAIEACLARDSAAEEPARCIGAASERCMATPGGETTIRMGSCVAAEASGWDMLLNEAYSAARKAMDAGASTALRDAQRAWLSYRDAGCAVWDEVFRGGSMAQLSRLSCLMEQTARRTLELREIHAAASG